MIVKYFIVWLNFYDAVYDAIHKYVILYRLMTFKYFQNPFYGLIRIHIFNI